MLAGCLLALPLGAQQKESACSTIRQLMKTIRVYHVAPVPADSAFGERVLQQFVGGLDPFGLYLTRNDVRFLRDHFLTLDEQSKSGGCRFYEVAVQIFSDRYRYADSLRQSLIRQPIHWQAADTIRIFHGAGTLAADQKELAVRWRQQLKYMLLQEAYTESGGKALQPEKLAGLKESVLQRLNCRRSRMLGTATGLQDHVQEVLLEAIATAFDPHTSFLPHSVKQQFEASLSAEAESFGIGLSENRQGDIQIEHLSPGGPAWKTNELHQGDVLLKLRSQNGGEKTFSCASVSEADLLLNDASHRHIYLTVRKQNGKTKTVELVKEKLQVEENVVQSFVLAGERKIGYLSLPGFYTQWDEQGRERGSANDVARELLKLKREGVVGLILDLRYNGGGSVQEALNLAGMFIDEGPLGIEQMRGEKPRLMKDMNRGTLYDDPLIVLVNGFSASAAEILAQALQNYNRAVIVGGKTYGKATMQSLIPLQATQLGYQPKSDDDFVKITISRYYNLKGSTYQYEGVQPDVLLEDGLGALGLHESASPTALRADQIQKQLIYYPLPPMPLQQLAVNSTQRLQQNGVYQQQLAQAKALRKVVAQGMPLRLTPEGFQQDYARLSQLMEQEESQKAAVSSFALHTLASTDQLLQLNPERKVAHEQLKQELAKDVWLGETYHIMLDLLKGKR